MRLFIIAFFSLLLYSPFVQAQQYLWPTDSGQYLSSTFGETRSTHFHAGLDIKTWGQEGYRVFASRDGILYRLLVTERGYGKAIYLKHSDSTYTVYAHLQRFNDEFQAISDSIRLQDYSFEMDAKLDTLGIEVKKGELIGYTGSTGIGPPHLHFEIRDSLENPINALTTNLSVKDHLAPVFSSLIVEPLTKTSRIEGKPASHFSRARQIGDNSYNFGTIRLTGKAGFAVNVYDQANDVPNAYAIYTLALIQKSDTLFYEELKEFSYEDDGEMFLDRIAPFGSARRGHQRLYEKDGQQNPFYKQVKPGAQVQATNEQQTYTIIATDYFGNRAKAEITIVPDSSYKNESPDLSLPAKDWYWSENWASPDLENILDLTRKDLGFPWTNTQQIVRPDTSKTINFTRITPGKTQKVTTPDRRLLLRFGEQAFFDTLTIASSYSVLEDSINISIQPQMLAVKSGFGIEFFMGDDFKSNNRYRLFRIDPSDGDLSYVDSRLMGGTIHAYPDELGEFIIKADNASPEISNFKVFKSDYNKWIASVNIKDELTGVESSSAKFIINGKRGIAEYDYEEDLLIYYLPDFVPKTVNMAEITVEDKAGNQTFLKLEYQIPGF